MLGGELGFFDRAAAGSDAPLAGGGILQIVTAPEEWPAMAGLGGGILVLDSQRVEGPTLAGVDFEGNFHLDQTDIVRRLQLRHAELLARVQPFWGRVRPHLEGALGLAATWYDLQLRAQGDDALIESDERQVGVGLLLGFGLGLDVRLSHSTGAQADVDLLLTVMARRWVTTPMPHPTFVEGGGGTFEVSEGRAPVRYWSLYVGLTLSIDSRSDR